MVILQHHVDAEGFSTKRYFYSVDRNPLGIGSDNFILYMDYRNAKCLIL